MVSQIEWLDSLHKQITANEFIPKEMKCEKNILIILDLQLYEDYIIIYFEAFIIR